MSGIHPGRGGGSGGDGGVPESCFLTLYLNLHLDTF